MRTILVIGGGYPVDHAHRTATAFVTGGEPVEAATRMAHAGPA